MRSCQYLLHRSLRSVVATRLAPQFYSSCRLRMFDVASTHELLNQFALLHAVVHKMLRDFVRFLKVETWAVRSFAFRAFKSVNALGRVAVWPCCWNTLSSRLPVSASPRRALLRKTDSGRNAVEESQSHCHARFCWRPMFKTLPLFQRCGAKVLATANCLST